MQGADVAFNDLVGFVGKGLEGFRAVDGLLGKELFVLVVDLLHVFNVGGVEA